MEFIMAKFVYRMQNILNIKYKLEDQAKTEFMIANRILQEEESKLEELEERKAFYEKEGRLLLSKNLAMDKIKENRQAILSMNKFIDLQLKRVEEAKHQVEIKAAKLAELMKERKAQEKLREKAFENFLQEENSKESKEIDELVSFTYGKRQKEE